MPGQLAPYGAGKRHPASEIGGMWQFLHHLPMELVIHNQFDKYRIDGEDSAFYHVSGPRSWRQQILRVIFALTHPP